MSERPERSGLRPRRPTHRIKTKIQPLRITKGYIDLFNGNDLGQARAGLGSRGLRTQRLGGPQLSPQPALKDADCTPFQGTHQTCSFPLGEPTIPLNSEICFHLLCSVVSSRGPCLAQVQNCFVDLRVCPVAPNVVQVIIKIYECFIGAAVQE